MATLVTRAHEQTGLTPRRDAAVASLAERRGVAAPPLRLSRLSDLTPREQDSQVSGVALAVFVAESLVALAAEVDELKAEIAALTGAKKGTK